MYHPKKIVEIPPTVIDNQHKNLNIPSGNINILSSEFQLPHSTVTELSSEIVSLPSS